MTEKINKGKSMLKRVIKILTNKPTKIDRPVFTKYFEKENKQIKDLEQLLKISNDASKKIIEQDIKKLRYGHIGENNVYYELKNSFIPMICLHNVRLKYKGMVAQIDFLAITCKYIYVIECKNLIGDITINSQGEFIRHMKNSHGKVISKEGMYSPIVQNEKHINVLKEILKQELKYKNKLKRVESLIVTANPKTIINKTYAPKYISDKIIRHDQIIDKIQSYESDNKTNWVFIEDDMRKISEILLKYHKEAKIDYNKKYNLPIKGDKKYNTYTSSKYNDIKKEAYSKKNQVKIKSDEELRRLLKTYRLKRSKQDNLQPYMIFNNSTMEELIKIRPKDLYELRNIRGFGETKCEKYGKDLINMII